MSEGRFITASDLGLPQSANAPAVTLAEIRSKAEKDAIEQALQRHGYKLSEAAADLGVSRATLYRLMHANRVSQDGASGRASDAAAPQDDEDSERDLPSLTASTH
jgi:DNA-binding NtrC family response regulator